jgi:hypothetical protein
MAIPIAIKNRSGKNPDRFLFFIRIAFYLQKSLRTEKTGTGSVPVIRVFSRAGMRMSR